MSVFVERDGAGKIKAMYANKQANVPPEELADDQPEVIAFRNRSTEPVDDARTAAMKADPAYIDLFNRATTSTPAQIDQWFTTNVTTLAQARQVLSAIVKILAVRL